MKYDNAMMKTAYVWAEESYCKRKQVGAVIAKDSRIIAQGYNGTISGAENCCEEEDFDEVKSCPTCGHTKFWPTDSFGLKNGTHCQHCDDKREYEDLKTKKIPKLVSKNTVVHAEANAILWAAKNGIPTNGCTLYVTLSPCIECSKMIVQSGIKEVIFAEDYRITHGVEYLQEHGIEVRQHDNSN